MTQYLADFLTRHPSPIANTLTYDEFVINKEPYLSQLKEWIIDLNTYIHTIILDNAINTLCDINGLMPDLLTLRTKIIDDILINLFNFYHKNSTLFAIGGYGRGELLPYSDIDILIIYNDNAELERLKEFVSVLWDLGITPFVRIHYIDDNNCVGDITIATSLLENRFLTGNETHKDLPLSWLKNHYTATTFFNAKHKEYYGRHKKLGFNEYVLEPDIKDGVGGLRDIHFLHWIAKFYFNLPPEITLQSLVNKGFLTQNECNDLMTAKHFLWLIRHHLHMLEQKDNNKLSFGNQKTIAKLMNYKDNDNNPNYAPETLMKEYYRCAMNIASLSKILGQLFFNQFLGKVNRQLLDDNYFIAHTNFGEQLGICDELLFQKNPSEILKVFLIMGEQGIKSLSPKTFRALRQSIPLITEEFLDNCDNQSLFLQNLDEPNYLFHRLRLMKRTGVLGAYLPDFYKIIGLSQYDLFHSYTVDAHTLMLIRMLHRFYQDDFGLLSTVYQGLDNPLIMVISAIFHDIAKGLGGDHSELGAELVANFCQKHQLNQKDSDLAEWLVRHHLVMSVTAQKKDIYDPNVVDEFARFVGDIRHLDYLYVLTVADMNATNSQLWNNWRASLLKQLYLSTHAKFDKNSDNSPKAIIAQKQAFVLEKIEQKQEIINFWQGLPDSYFLRQSKSEMLWHATSVLNWADDLPLVAIIPHKNKSLHAHKLLIYSKNMPSLFALTVVILDKFGFAVYNADILTDSRDFALDTYTIVDKQLANKSIVSPNAPLVAESGNLDKVIVELKKHLQNPQAFFGTAGLSIRYSTDKLKHFEIKTQVFFEPNGDGTHNLHIITKDRPSLLAKIGLVFGQVNVSVQSAKIITLGERAEDVFCVSDVDGELSDERQAFIKEKLEQALAN